MADAVLERLNAALRDHYRIGREIGAGGMATVYLAHDGRHDREVAIKVLRPELAAVVGAERFLAEIKTTASLQHPHILPLFDSGEANGGTCCSPNGWPQRQVAEPLLQDALDDGGTDNISIRHRPIRAKGGVSSVRPLAEPDEIPHDSIMSDTPTPRGEIQVLAILSRDPAAETVRRLLVEEGLSVTAHDTAARKDAWKDGVSAEAVIVDEILEPAEVAEALERGWIRSSAPLFVLARRLPDRDRYMAWLEAGAWDILKIPLEAVALALRLRNMLAGQSPDEAGSRAQRYSLSSLAQAADEALALAHRYERPLHCTGLAVDWPDASDADLAPLMERLADAAQRLTRRSDLIGVGDGRTVLILLPDTDTRGTDIFRQRLQETLEGRLREWEVVATLRSAVASADGMESGRALLDAVVEELATPP